MKLWSGVGSKIIKAIQQRAERKRLNAPGPIGDFWRAGGNRLLYEDLPISQHHTVIDAGGYAGEWTSAVLTRYGCHSELFEPAPKFANRCRALYSANARVRVHQTALGGNNRRTRFTLADNGTSEFRSAAVQENFQAEVRDISEFLSSWVKEDGIHTDICVFGALKLNIEGGEYEVLERLFETGDIARIRCLLIQFHRQPPEYEKRYLEITRQLRKTHHCVFAYPFVWERWDIRDKESAYQQTTVLKGLQSETHYRLNVKK